MKPVTFFVMGNVGRCIVDVGVGYAIYDSSRHVPMSFCRKGISGGGVIHCSSVYMPPFRSFRSS